MKYIDNSNLSSLSDFLSFTSANVRVATRIEAYSCKPVARERKMYRALESDLVADIDLMSSISPPHHDALIDSAFGPLDQKSNRKTYLLLIATLNTAFPDHNFSTVRADEFVREPNPRSVLASLSANLSKLTAAAYYHRPIVSSSPGKADDIPIHPRLRDVLDPIIGLDECEVYSYTPDTDSDPHANTPDPADDDIENEDDEENDNDENNTPNNSNGYVNVHVRNSSFGTDDSSMQISPSLSAVDDQWHMEGLGNDQQQPGVGPHGTGPGPFGSHGRRRSSLPSVLPHLLDVSDPNAGLGTDSSVAMDEDTVISSAPSVLHDNNSAGGNSHFIDTGVEDADNESEDSDDQGDGDNAGGLLWSANYFFHNRKMKRIIFVTIWGRKVSSNQGSHHLPVPPNNLLPSNTGIGHTINKSPAQQFMPLTSLEDSKSHRSGPASLHVSSGTASGASSRRYSRSSEDSKKPHHGSGVNRHQHVDPSESSSNPIRSTRRLSRIKASATTTRVA